jgi:hypothetical protein
MAESSPDKFTYENKIAERFGGQKRVGASRADPIGNSIVRNERGRQLRRPLYSARKGADRFTFRSRAQHLRRRSAGDAARPLLTAGFWPLDLVSGDLGEGRPPTTGMRVQGLRDELQSMEDWKTTRKMRWTPRRTQDVHIRGGRAREAGSKFHVTKVDVSGEQISKRINCQNVDKRTANRKLYA